VFVDREAELNFLDSILTRTRPTPAQLILIYGRRRVGKSTLLQHWVEQTGLPYTYWTAEKDPPALQRHKLFEKVRGKARKRPPISLFRHWAECWEAIADELDPSQRHILVLDEFNYAAAGEKGMLSSLQLAWDETFKKSQLVIILAGSHVHAMESIMAYQSPLFGRLTGSWWLRPLPFAVMQDFFPRWSAEERVAAYGCMGGVPAYWEWLDPRKRFTANLEQLLLPGSPFISEPMLLLYDELQEPGIHLAALQAIGAGRHTVRDIADHAMVDSKKITAYLGRLQQLRLIERRLPATTVPAERKKARKGNYHISDPFFRFYFRFLAPHVVNFMHIPQREDILADLRQGLRAFVGGTIFEELCREWVLAQSAAGQLPFAVKVNDLGAHWSRNAQVDVVGCNWEQRGVIIGECKWADDEIHREIIRELVDKKVPDVLMHLPNLGQGWQTHLLLFARTGFTAATRAYAQTQGIQLVEVEQLDADLRAAFERQAVAPAEESS